MTYNTDFKSVGGEFDWISFESLSDYQFQNRWERLLDNKGSRFFKLVCEHFDYDYSNADNVPFDSSMDEESLLEYTNGLNIPTIAWMSIYHTARIPLGVA